MTLPDLVTLTADESDPPPAWALLQRKLIAFIEGACEFAAAKYSRPDGSSYHENDVDDMYESRSYRGLLYAMGGSDRMLEIAYPYWNSATAHYDNSIAKHPDEPRHPQYVE